MIADLPFATLMDGLVAILLIATIGYAVTLNRKLARLRNDRGEMEALIARLIEATDAAQKGLEGLSAHAKGAGERLQKGLEQARGQTDELAFLLERADLMARRLDAAVAVPQTPAMRYATPSLAGARPAPTRAAAPGKAPLKSSPKPSPKAPPEEAGLLKALQDLR